MGSKDVQRPRPAVIIADAEWAHFRTLHGLSPQQTEIVQAFVDGYSKPEDIAKALGTGVSGIKKQIERLYEKIDAHSRAEVLVIVFAEVLAMRGNLTQP